ncbi:hypothetical protein CPAST_c07590 [Clostridium pasteurianum DSM 525 = ATCC 6013]|uniref:Uncharacterized protein n=1 Tax=Clostridium pasteurianum DSM 525 = ATCC 6013 TaxID=1262449 RepID=A0A0H3J0I8_CLOPA|nr:hypothetical protein [Clostridium pasteurianum]AJA46859.1 hypothetical protein CPAST_c07590 [Clostridium pasteurianum DSM 525 = ATCC 6013]AJA50847.1 hypothetical protein CLPA_c07590 [Clostridium pasteurianum DSM 525 = ATCC 6013]AOZ74246.1 hypothetical protein AQ983_03655 [Clostridium pasteurianum DSM 525 = ATCC 6013]AOZ78044.1 hypothetical protein AQ984_03655 [Clostridium pasteurianum]ELP58529.1 hypothetical protein F502_13645 [Clostridium pasteurianum DSM 525 = ATCC 6013]
MDHKKLLQRLSFAGVFVGFTISGFLYKYLGISEHKSSLIVIAICIVIFLSIIMYLIYKKHYLGALILFLPMLPVFIGIVGTYIGNMYMIIGGLVGFFIVGIAIIKIASKYIPK